MSRIQTLEAAGPDLPLNDADGPVFEQPWQAQAFSLVVCLHKSGLFPWKEWVRIFSDEIKASPARPGEGVNDAYYRQWLAATEQLIASFGLADGDAISQRAEEWRLAYLNTPHGQPVALSHATCPPPHSHHDHVALRRPVTVSAARRA